MTLHLLSACDRNRPWDGESQFQDAASRRNIVFPRACGWHGARSFADRMGSLVSNLRFAARSLVRRPGISFLIIATLGLGIGANSAIFSLAYTMLVVPYDLPEVERPSWARTFRRGARRGSIP